MELLLCEYSVHLPYFYYSIIHSLFVCLSLLKVNELLTYHVPDRLKKKRKQLWKWNN